MNPTILQNTETETKASLILWQSEYDLLTLAVDNETIPDRKAELEKQMCAAYAIYEIFWEAVEMIKRYQRDFSGGKTQK